MTLEFEFTDPVEGEIGLDHPSMTLLRVFLTLIQGSETPLRDV